MKKNQVKLSNLKPSPPVIFSGTFDAHMTVGDKKGTSHSGLHLIGEFRKTEPAEALKAGDIVKDATFAGRLNDRATTVTITEVDPRTKTFKASVNIYGEAKVSTFFPIGTTLASAKDYIRAAWRDACIYGSSAYGGGDVDIYNEMRKAFGMNWVGMATINAQETWIGCEHSGSVDTAFPAVNNKFGK